MAKYPIGKSDVFIVSSNSGRNSVSIEMAQIAKEKEAKVIVLTNMAHSLSVDSRHASWKKLYELADLYLDNCGEIGDASIALEGLECKVGPTSTVIGTALLQAIMVQAVGTLLERGVVPEIFTSSNSDSGEVHIEIRQLTTWTYFFQAFGRNPLILYVLSGILISIFFMIPFGESSFKDWLYGNLFSNWLNPKRALPSVSRKTSWVSWRPLSAGFRRQLSDEIKNVQLITKNFYNSKTTA
jgi:hypothetical protein